MTRVYFHCSNSRGVSIDRYGAAVDDLAEARDHAACVVRSLNMAQSSEDWRSWILHVSDDLGGELFVVPLHSCWASRIERVNYVRRAKRPDGH
jgi:hypothetical protein